MERHMGGGECVCGVKLINVVAGATVVEEEEATR